VPDWFDADTWPLEAAIAWLLYGDKRLVANEARRPDRPSSKSLTFRARLLENEKAAARYEVYSGSLYRATLRDGWSLGASGVPHPVDRAIKQALSILRTVRAATGVCSNGTQRTPIPPKVWKLSRLIDDPRLGLILHTARGGVAWRCIDVPAARFRAFRAKRGRRPEGLVGSKRPGSSITTLERIQRNERRMGLAFGEKRGRPRSREVYP
jgi:hypothetical protein